jgi:hypothetical protein
MRHGMHVYTVQSLAGLPTSGRQSAECCMVYYSFATGLLLEQQLSGTVTQVLTTRVPGAC